MITGVDEASAMAIIEHAENLSADAGQTTPVNTDLRVASVAQFPSESDHWYDSKTGQQVELPKGTRDKTAIKRGLVPGVTSITKVAHKEAIQRWMVNRAILFTREALSEYEIPCLDHELISDVWQLLNADSEAITGRGKELHGAIELYSQKNESWDKKWTKHICELVPVLLSRGIELDDGSTEHSFATSRYGGKIDWHNDEWLLDFKTKPSIEDGKKLAYPEHAQQLAAYAYGLEGDRWHLLNGLKCANVFIGVEDAKVVFHEWTEKKLVQGWEEFECWLNAWWKIATRKK